MNEIKFDEFFKDNFDTTGIEENIYNQIAKDMARSIDIDLAKTPLVDILTGYTRYKIQELEIDHLNSIIKEAREFIYKCNDGKQGINYSGCSELLEILDKVGETDVKD